MAKHAERQFIIARTVFGSAAALLLGLVGWVAIRSGGGPEDGSGQPLLVQPTTTLQAAEGVLPAVAAPPVESFRVTPSASSSPTPSPSKSSPSPSPSKSSPTPSQSTGKPSLSVSSSPSRTSPSPVAEPLAVTYSTSASWRDGFIAAVRVVNNGTSARDWTVTVTYPGSADIDVRGTWNAAVSRSGDTVTLRGKSLAAGASVTAGFQAAKDTDGLVKPISCALGGGACRMS
ncbi:cellulose binding domain-containing protein [Actinoplanes utahensis]|uniref:CBM2 domain-containing protein n=1 Tax=Actinoplanes utahensis TaxID=1869 RepID=A0A0A6UU58_ACTUT|nr:cellulose binding domain-containing protein [Actinoplanes utahensis]KHD78906.1 hypothetical protein MB27_02055 [Actinoplanes utahensis]GIF28138.1 hypothetical protein Aut01nite_11240 [Actinoplanes utahensis]